MRLGVALRCSAVCLTLLIAGSPGNAADSPLLSSSQPAGLIAAETPAATPYYVQDSGKSGPTVMVLGGAHGDEPAGAYAAEQIRHWPITKGKMIVLPRQNVVALAAQTRTTPGEPSDLANLNRNFPKSTEAEASGALAKAIWELTKKHMSVSSADKGDGAEAWLLDLHEGTDFGNGSVGSSVVACPKDRAREAAAVLLNAINETVAEPTKKFILRSPPIDGSLARAASQQLGAQTLILETTRKDQALSLRARQHRIMVHALLKHLGMIGEQVTPEWMTDHSAKEHIFVAVYDAQGTGGSGVRNVCDLLSKEKNITALQVGPEDLRRGALDQFGVLVCPGGGATGQAKAISEEGCLNIKRFVENGGGYLGICAGSYLACEGFSWGLKILNAQTVSSKWKRGIGMVKIELTDAGREILGDLRGQLEVKYANGPILEAAQSPALPPFETLAYFRTELARNDTPEGIMVNSPAIVAGRCGKGRIICSSPHPEQSAVLGVFIPRAVRWVAGR